MSKSSADSRPHAGPDEPFAPAPKSSYSTEHGPHGRRDSASPLSRAMAAVDREMDEQGRVLARREIVEETLDESLESELLHDLRYGRIDSLLYPETAPRPGRTEFAAGKVERTCDEIIDDAHADVLVRRVIEARDKLSVMLADLPTPMDTPSPPPRVDAAGSFRMARAARRTALACSVAALLAGGVYFAAAPGSDVGQLLARILPATTPAEAEPAREATFAAAVALPKPERRAPVVVAVSEPAAAPAIGPAAETVETPENLAAAAGPDELSGEALEQRMSQDAAEAPDSPTTAALEAALRDKGQAEAEPSPARPEIAPKPVRTTVVRSAPPASDLGLAFAGSEPAREAETQVEALLAAPPAGNRDPQAVETALASALGLESLDGDQKEALKDRLVAGECASDALAGVIGRVPVLAMRDLVQHLNGNCLQ